MSVSPKLQHLSVELIIFISNLLGQPSPNKQLLAEDQGVLKGIF
jgi:hypothetical protein